MRILLLSLYFEPDIAANAAIMTELTQELLERGHQVTVVTAFPHYAKNVTVKKYRGRLLQREENDRLTVIRTYSYTSPAKERFLVRLFNYISFNVLSTIAGLFSGPQDVIFAPSPPLTIGFSAAVIGFIKRIPFIYNVQDVIPDVLIKLDILKNPLLITFSKWLERFVYSRASHISVLTEGFQNNLLQKGVEKEKISIIPNFADPDFIRPLPKGNSFREENNLGDKFVVLYAGNLGHSQNLELLLHCADLLRKHRELAFLIVGNGSRKQQLLAEAERLNLTNVTFLPFQPRERVPDIYAAADLSLVTLSKGIALDSFPSKVYTIMASARPVLAAVDPGSDVWNLVGKANCGVCVEPENPGELAASLRFLRSRPDLLEEYGRNGREYILQVHTPQIVGERYHHLFENTA